MLSQGLAVFLAVLVICQGADITWQVRLKTSDVAGAGTNAGVFIQIIGEEGKTPEIELDSEINNFERNLEETFIVNLTDVGAPKQLRVYHDNLGASAPGWHLNWIELESVNDDYPGSYLFNCDCWLATDQLQDGLEKTLPLSTMDWQLRVTTSNIAGAGSYSRVWVTITGDEGTTRQVEVKPEGNFVQGETDVFNFKTVDVGTPSKIRVHTEHNDDWNLQKMVLEDLDGVETYTFNCYCWLGLVGKTIVNLEAV